MNDFLLWVIVIGVGCIIWGLVTAIHLLKDLLKEVALIKRGVTHILSSVSTTQSSLRMAKRSDPYPARPRPKATQHYEGQGIPREERGSTERSVTASGTPVRVGSIARRRAGGSVSDTSGS